VRSPKPAERKAATGRARGSVAATTSIVDEHLVIHASALVDLLVTERLGLVVGVRIEGCVLHAPAHVDADVLAVLGRLHRAGALEAGEVARLLEFAATAPIERHDVAQLLAGAWRRRDRLNLVDALYVELADSLDLPLLTTDGRLARHTERAEVVSVRGL
jgi:predicted nucleic acid-binding protein